LKLEPKNAHNALLFSNLGLVQRKLGRYNDAVEEVFSLYQTVFSDTLHSLFRKFLIGLGRKGNRQEAGKKKKEELPPPPFSFSKGNHDSFSIHK